MQVTALFRAPDDDDAPLLLRRGSRGSTPEEGVLRASPSRRRTKPATDPSRSPDREAKALASREAFSPTKRGGGNYALLNLRSK